MKKQFCPYCGTKLDEGARFCKNCGEAICGDAQEAHRTQMNKHILEIPRRERQFMMGIYISARTAAK